MPTYTDTTEQVYALLPEHHRVADDAQPAPLDQPLKRYLSTIGDQLDVLVALLDRLAREDGDEWASDLADPTEADAAWLPWLAQTVGADSSLAVPALRAAIGAGFLRGSWGSMEEVLEAQMPGDWMLAPHSSGEPFLIGLVVPAAAPGETWWADLLDALEALLPAGHAFEVTASDIWTYAHVGATYDSYADLLADNTDYADLLDGP